MFFTQRSEGQAAGAVPGEGARIFQIIIPEREKEPRNRDKLQDKLFYKQSPDFLGLLQNLRKRKVFENCESLLGVGVKARPVGK